MIPLWRAALCLDCEMIFALGEGEPCPACASRAWVLVPRYLKPLLLLAAADVGQR